MMKKILLAFSLIVLLMTTSAGNAAEKAALPPTTTQLETWQCGTTVAAMNTNIYAYIVTGATNYRFRLTCTLPNATVQVQTVTTLMRVFNFTLLTSPSFARSYSVEVAACVGGVWQAYGPACTINSPSATTVIQTSQCGLTMASIYDPVYANIVSYAQGYRFRVTDVTNPALVYILDRSVREFRLNLFPVASGRTYNVEVAIKNYDGTYLPYGPGCSITAPNLYTKVMAAYCGRVISSFTEYIYADYVQAASGYRWKITNMANMSTQYIDTVNRAFTMSMLTNVQYNAAYRIEVSIKDPSGVYLPYGPFCTIFTPLLPAPKIQLSQCEITCISNSEMMYADDYPGATVYRFRLENTQLGYSHYIDRTVRCYNLSMFGGLQPNLAYTVKVAVKVNGVFTSFGKGCDVTTPSSANRMADTNEISNDTSFMPKLYPNPFSEYFSIDAALQAAAEVSVKVFDMMGRLLDSNKTKAADLQNLQLGSSYPPGIYNVVIAHDDDVKTHRVIKR